MQSETKGKKRRREVFKEIVGAFEEKYSWLGHQTARELLLSAASWNIEKNNDNSMRMRTHVMLAWKRGWLKSSLLTHMAGILGDDLCAATGKVTNAGMRGSVSSGQFTPPKPLKAPIVVSTEFGQTSFEDELLNLFLSLMEEGRTNITLNKIGQLPEKQKKKIEKRYDGQISFGESNEFDLRTDFVFWGATYDPRKLQDDALRSRFNIVTPAQPLVGEVTETIDKGKFRVSKKAVRDCRRMLKSDEESDTDFTLPSHLYKKYRIDPRLSRDAQAYMAARNWWGLDVNPEIMEDYIKHLKESRRKSMMNPSELVFDMIFDNPMSYEEIMDETGMSKKEVYKIIQNELNAVPVPHKDGRKWVIYSRDSEEDEEDDDDGFLGGL